MIKVETCRGCGRPLYIHPVANLTVRLDVEPLDAQEAVTALIAGRNLWRVTATSVTGARPAELSALRQRGTTEGPCIVQEHACTALRSPQTPTPARSVQPTPQEPSAGRTAPFSGPQAAPCSVPSAATRVSDTPPCSICQQPIRLDATDTYAMIELGSVLVDIFHAGPCPERV